MSHCKGGDTNTRINKRSEASSECNHFVQVITYKKFFFHIKEKLVLLKLRTKNKSRFSSNCFSLKF